MNPSTFIKSLQKWAWKHCNSWLWEIISIWDLKSECRLRSTLSVNIIVKLFSLLLYCYFYPLAQCIRYNQNSLYLKVLYYITWVRHHPSFSFIILFLSYAYIMVIEFMIPLIHLITPAFTVFFHTFLIYHIIYTYHATLVNHSIGEEFI